MSKGDSRRPRSSHVSEEDYKRNFEAIFGKKELKTWDPTFLDVLEYFGAKLHEEMINEQTECIQDQPEDAGGNPGPTEGTSPCPGDPDGEGGQAGGSPPGKPSNRGG